MTAFTSLVAQRATLYGATLTAWLLIAACGSTGNVGAPTPNARPTPSAAEQTPSAARSHDLVFTGMCDASGAIALSATRFVVADDEDNVLRVYDSDAPGPPLRTTDLSAFLGSNPDKPKEADIEAATRVGEIGLWLASHGRNKKGRAQPTRLQLFATTLPADGSVAALGQPYRNLLDNMLAAPQLAPLGLSAAAQIAPKEPGGLNLEGMTARHDNESVLIGFRNPQLNGRAILVPLLNPRTVVQGQAAQLGEPVLVDFEGLGVRDLTRFRDRYLVLAGGIATEQATRLFSWDGESSVATPLPIALSDLNPEALLVDEDRDRVLVLSDDGSLVIDGAECKRLNDPARKQFRARWIRAELE